MAGKKDNSEPANKTSQDFFQQAVDSSDDADLGDGGTPTGDPIEPEYDVNHPYFKEQSSDDDGGEKSKDENSLDTGKTPIPDKDNPDRYQYWQSMATKQQQKIDQLLEAMQNNQSENSQNNAPEKTPQEVLAEKQQALSSAVVPDKPEKPSAYNAQDAYTDPDSASFKYRQAMDEWNEKFVDVTQQREQLRSEIFDIKLQMVENPVKQMTAKTQLSERNQQTVDYLKEKHKFTDEDAMDFIQVMSKPESMSMENLVEFYRHKKGVQSPTNQSSANRDNRSPKREAAPPIPTGSGAGKSSTDDDEAELGIEFGRSLLSINR